MKLRTRVVCQLAALCFVLAASSFAADNAYLYIVQGIPGRDIAENLNPGLPVDVLINGDTCIPRDLSFESIVGPYTFSPGTYEVLVSESNTLAPCTNTPIINSQVTLTSGASVSAVIAISGGSPTLLQFTNNVSSVAADKARFVLSHAADAGELLATLTQQNVTNPKTFTMTADPGKQGTITIPSGTYLVEVTLDGSTTVFASETISVGGQSATFLYAVGEAANKSVRVVRKTVPLVL
jgi:hypothetical protein